MAAGTFTPYSGVAGWMAALPSWVNPVDQERIAAYQIYEEIYWNYPETFKLVLRGDEAAPIYLPNARTVVETLNRYVGKGLQVGVDPVAGTPNDRTDLQLALDTLLKKERFYSKYTANKRYGIMRGDWLFHVTADPKKMPGTRIAIQAIDPASYFTVPMPDDEDRIWKIHLAEQFIDTSDNNTVKVRRQTYTRLDDGRIQSELSVWKQDEWFVDGKAALQVITSPFVLPNDITAFPVYHLRFNEQPGNPFGSSAIRGFERLLQAINQSATDEDIALALEGLGLYTSDGGAPVDEDGDETDWVIGPGRVVENAPGFKRVNGISSIGPYLNHMDYIKNSMFEAGGISDAAIGKIDVQVAESGVALALRMAPTLAVAEDNDLVITEVMTQMWYDITTMWFPAYESQSFGEAVPRMTLGDKLPKNRDSEVKMVMDLLSSPVPVMSADTARKHLAKYGFEFSESEEKLVWAERVAAAQAALGNMPTTDASSFDQRAQKELGG